MSIKHISAVTLAVQDMARSMNFYQELGFEPFYGGSRAGFSSLKAGGAVINLAATSAYIGTPWASARPAAALAQGAPQPGPVTPRT